MSSGVRAIPVRDQALGLVGSALSDGRSKASHVHGSVGSGKSHSVAMLSLLLRNDEQARRVPQLHALRERHRFVEQAKVLELHFHMTDKTSLEAARPRSQRASMAQKAQPVKLGTRFCAAMGTSRSFP